MMPNKDEERDFNELMEQCESVVREPFDLDLRDDQEKNTSYLEVYGTFGTFISYRPGQQIKDAMGNIYEATALSSYNKELGLYITPAQLVQPRSFDKQTTEAIEKLGGDITLMNEREVLWYADLKIREPGFEFNEWERQQFTRQGRAAHKELLAQLDRIDVTQLSQLIDKGQLGEVTPERGDDFMSQKLLEPAPQDFNQSVKSSADLQAQTEHFRDMFER